MSRHQAQRREHEPRRHRPAGAPCSWTVIRYGPVPGCQDVIAFRFDVVGALPIETRCTRDELVAYALLVEGVTPTACWREMLALVAGPYSPAKVKELIDIPGLHHLTESFGLVAWLTSVGGLLAEGETICIDGRRFAGRSYGLGSGAWKLTWHACGN